MPPPSHPMLECWSAEPQALSESLPSCWAPACPFYAAGTWAHGDWPLQGWYPKCGACNGKGKQRFPVLPLNTEAFQRVSSRSSSTFIVCTCTLAGWRIASTLLRNSPRLLHGKDAEAWELLLVHHWEAGQRWPLLILAEFPLSAEKWKCRKLTCIFSHVHGFKSPTKNLSSGWALPGFPRLLFWISGQEAEAIHCQTDTEETHDSGTLLVGLLPFASAHQSKQVSAWNGEPQEENITRCRVQTKKKTPVILLPHIAMQLQNLLLLRPKIFADRCIWKCCSAPYYEKVFTCTAGLRSEPTFAFLWE